MSARPKLWAAGWVIAILLTAILTVAVQAPAAWFGDWLQAQGKLRLIDARGSLWEGSAMLAVSDGRKAMLLPGRFAWKINPWPVFAGRIEARLSHSAMQIPLALRISKEGLVLAAGRAELPAAALMALAGPFATIRPGGALELRWTELVLRPGSMVGSLEIDWRDARSALTTVAPFGTYQVKVTGAGDTARVQLDTLRGPLRMQGGGSLKAGRLSFRGAASVDPEMRHALGGLLGLLGPRSGDNVALVLDT